MEYGLIGEKLGHSYSPQIHRFFGDYDYRLYPMSKAELFETLTQRNFKGLNVTIPYKRDVLPFCDAISDTVRAVGSANTLYFRDGKLCAENTDLPGMLSMLARAGISLTDRKAVILGSGGTSLTAQAACRAEKAREYIVVSRQGPVTYEALYQKHTDADVIINATPVGMYPNNLVSPIDLSRFPHLSGVADVIYNPAKTALLLDAEAAGIPCIDGLWMLVAQAWHAAKLFLDREIPEETVERAYRAVRRDCLNLVLVGMPGSGKSTQGRLTAEALDRPFVDLDAEIVKRYGPIPEIFSSKGEAAFRDMESEIVREYGKQNGVIGWIQRSLHQLSTDGRPLSSGLEALQKMEEARLPLYRACADFSVISQPAKEETTNRIVEGFNEAAGFERP